jgi:polyphosphate kinase 2 (PPK2 family)
MPARGELVIFDRSWYGRVLVERVEKLCERSAWRRAFDEIVFFEEMHADDGCVIMKFWLHVTKQEQLRRFREREKDPFKEYKIGASDWRSRKHWREYIDAAEEMLERTHRPNAAWHVISGDDKHHARIAVLHAVVERLSKVIE